MRYKKLMIYLIPIVIILLDQLTKILVLNNITEHTVVAVMPCFNLLLTFNKGVSFSLLTSDSDYAPYLLSAFAVGVSICLLYWLKKEKDKLSRVGLALILGGAIGNVIDRIRFGGVVDFLDFYIGTYHWPAFNVADSAICIGVTLILIKSIFGGKKK